MGSGISRLIRAVNANIGVLATERERDYVPETKYSRDKDSRGAG